MQAPPPAPIADDPSAVAAPPAPVAAAVPAPIADEPSAVVAPPAPVVAAAPAVAPAAPPPPRRSKPEVQQPPPPVRRPPTPPAHADPALEPTAAIDVEALNRVELDEDDARTLAVDGPAVGDGVLPFRKGVAKPPPAPLPIEPPGDDLGKTVAMGEMSPLRLPALPFDRPPQQDDDATAAIPEGATPAADAAAVATAPSERTERGAAPPRAGGGAAGGPLPPHLAALGVEHYAALCAECAIHPQRLEQIHERYRVASASERAALGAHWRECLAGDEQLGRQFRWHFARYQQWARQQP